MQVKHIFPASQDFGPQMQAHVEDDEGEAYHGSSSTSTTVSGESSPGKTESKEDMARHLNGDLDGDLALEDDELRNKGDFRRPSRGPRVWQVKTSTLKLSALEATIAVKRGLFTYDDLAL